jgi:hypothetical protein
MAEPNSEWLDTLQATELDAYLLRARRCTRDNIHRL